jgi:hypothetical protein
MKKKEIGSVKDVKGVTTYVSKATFSMCPLSSCLSLSSSPCSQLPVLCPSHLCKAWYEEFQKFTSKKLQVAIITTIKEYNALKPKELCSLGK